jgi:uncharacterized protein YjbI with pentapeptide repeats
VSAGPAPAEPISLDDDCGRCAALCCVGLTLTRSADFAVDKPAGVACQNLADDLRCLIHADLPSRGFPGCVAYTCYGAGPRVTAEFHPVDWRTNAEVGRAMFAALSRQRLLHELMWYLRSARAEPVSAPLEAELEEAHARTEELARGSAARADEDLADHRDRVNEVLLRASAELRGPRPGPDLRGADLVGARLAGRDLRRASLRGARLTGADLTGADLRGADLTGADLRGASLAGADLRGALFVTPTQLSSARVTGTTRLPGSSTRGGPGG